MKIKEFLTAAVLTSIVSCTPIYKKMNVDKATYESLDNGLYANLQTSKGNMLVKFEDKKSPVTVASFISLAEGKNTSVKAELKGKPYFDGTIFHRVIKDFMIQGGDPLGTGMGEPGYKFDDEKNDLKHLGKGYLSMANSGPNTNGSQFFITEVATPWLDGKHTVFGKVVKGEEVIESIASVERDERDKPKENVVLQKVSIFSKGDEYKHYDAAKVFEEGKTKIQENNASLIKKQEEEALKQLENLKKDMTQTASGLLYKITKKGSGTKAEAGKNVAVHYAGRLANGNEFDNSFKRGEPIEFTVGTGQVIRGWDEGLLLLNEGDEATFIIPPDLAYGTRGAGGVIPPNAWLIFDVKLVQVK